MNVYAYEQIPLKPEQRVEYKKKHGQTHRHTDISTSAEDTLMHTCDESCGACKPDWCSPMETGPPCGNCPIARRRFWRHRNMWFTD